MGEPEASGPEVVELFKEYRQRRILGLLAPLVEELQETGLYRVDPEGTRRMWRNIDADPEKWATILNEGAETGPTHLLGDWPGFLE